MIPFFPRKIANKGILVYLLSLAAVSILFFRNAMKLEFIVLGIIWITGFFLLSSRFSKKWAKFSSRRFLKTVFLVSLGLRLVWMVFSYFYYTAKTGQPFEFDSADALGYHIEALENSQAGWKYSFEYWAAKGGVSDVGYSFWLTLLYSVFGPSIIIARLFKCFFGSLTCVLVYKLASRNIGEFQGRMASIFCAFMPNLIIYCGMHVKETEMIFLAIAFLERADYLIRSRKYGIISIILPAVLALSLFFFRTVLGVVAIISFFAGLLFTSTRLTGVAKKIVVGLFGVVTIAGFAGGTIATEIEGYWDLRVQNEIVKREEQTSRGNQWAKYATGTVLAPMVFILPFSTMVDTGQENQMVLHAGNFVRNFLGFFVILALVYILFIEKKWRNLSLLGAYTVGYLGIISMSGYGNAERFLLPGLPCLLIFAAYGISKLNVKNIKYVSLWYAAVFLMEVGWAYFKIGSRGML